MITRATYAKLLQVAELTHLDPQEWADAILAQMADELIMAAEKPDVQNAWTVTAGSEVRPDCEPTDKSTGL
ncbi:hypothetical protein AWB67_06243 [Caballeronia terrestris]|jgi:hypothetical protein|uniref:Uncharacterized protein n=2 Tax=Caballeronia terrestris TaxID=1226301 RepID=A0A158KP04_9BURK|nr:hypothetical protein AWB67_06243 [Caballeronia terrestris]